MRPKNLVYKRQAFFLIGIALVFVLIRCSGAVQPELQMTPESGFALEAVAVQNNTPAATLTATPRFPPPTAIPPTQINTRPTPTQDCTNGLEFLADLTVPDGALIARGSQIDKRWQVKNTGTCNWDERYSLVLIAGTELGLPKQQALYPARSGSEAVIRMMLTSPFSPGVYTSAWQAFGPSGEPFGDVIYVQFQVN